MRHVTSAASLAVICLLAACDDATAPLQTTSGGTLSLSEFQSAIAGTARIEVQFTSTVGLVAREIDVEPHDNEEKIISRVMAIDTISGTLTLELGGMTIDYTSTTQFRTRSNSNATRSAWEVALIAELSAGLLPSIEARRGPIGSPQDPTSGAFSATDLRITPAITEAQIEVFVDLDNFQEASPPTLAVLTVFGLPVEILNSTQLRRQ